MKKKYRKEVKETLKFVGLLILIFLVFKVLFTYVPPLNQYNLFVIQTPSMDPIIAPDDIVIVKEINPEDIEVGDIMAFRVDITGDGNDDVVVHYIDEITPFNDELIFKTKPHVSELQDRWTIEESDLIGIYQYQINGVGNILSFAQSWVGIVFILIDIIIISVGYEMLFGKKKSKTENVIEDNEEVSNK